MAKTENRINENLVEIGGTVRVERGPALKTAKATEQLLSDDVTAPHYFAPYDDDVLDDNGKPVMDQKGKPMRATVVSRDAKGEPIEVGKEMTYLDWLADHHFYVYEKRTEPMLDAQGAAVLDDNGRPRAQERWVEVGCYAKEEAAMRRAHELAK